MKKIIDPRKLKGKKLESIDLYPDSRARITISKTEAVTTGNTIEYIDLRGTYEAQHNFSDLFNYYVTRGVDGASTKRKPLSVHLTRDFAPMIDDIAYLNIGWSSNLNGICLRVTTKSGAYFRLNLGDSWWIGQEVPYEEPAQ